MTAHNYKPGRRKKTSDKPGLIRKQVYIPEPDDVQMRVIAKETKKPYAEHIRKAVSNYLNGADRTETQTRDETPSVSDTNSTETKVSRVLGGASIYNTEAVSGETSKGSTANPQPHNKGALK